ncbi:MAG: diacylglycerol kinase family protein [Myxococcales bacterium]
MLTDLQAAHPAAVPSPSTTDSVAATAAGLELGSRRRGFAASLGFALDGLLGAADRGRNMKIQLVCGLLVALVGSGLAMGLVERLALLACVGAVLSAEAFNTAIEAAVDLATATFHEKARIAKDAAAGAVLVLSVSSTLVLLAILLDQAPTFAAQAWRIGLQLAAGGPLALCASLLLRRAERRRAVDYALSGTGALLLALLAAWTASVPFTVLAAVLFGACVAVALRRRSVG